MSTSQRLVLLGFALLLVALLAQFGTLFLFVAVILVAAFAGVAWRRAYLEIRANRQWLADESRYRAELAARGYTVLPDHVDASSLLDNSPAPLPETWRAPCGEPIRFPSSTNDRGHSAA
jgi:hypothetical protein